MQLARYALTDTLYILLGSWQGPISLMTQPVTGITFLSWGVGLRLPPQLCSLSAINTQIRKWNRAIRQTNQNVTGSCKPS